LDLHNNRNKTVIHTKSETINKSAIVTSLHKVSKLVVLEGNIKKTYGKQTSIFNTQNEWLYRLGAKKYVVEMNGKYEMGIDLNEIKDDDIRIDKNKIYIKLPSVELVSLDLPYENMHITNESGVFVSDYSIKEIKAMHKAARKEIEDELSFSTISREEALVNCYLELTELVTKINPKFEVRFIH
jgi:hypothetical protein